MQAQSSWCASFYHSHLTPFLTLALRKDSSSLLIKAIYARHDRSSYSQNFQHPSLGPLPPKRVCPEDWQDNHFPSSHNLAVSSRTSTFRHFTCICDIEYCEHLLIYVYPRSPFRRITQTPYIACNPFANVCDSYSWHSSLVTVRIAMQTLYALLCQVPSFVSLLTWVLCSLEWMKRAAAFRRHVNRLRLYWTTPLFCRTSVCFPLICSISLH